jgi:ribonuclease HI
MTHIYTDGACLLNYRGGHCIGLCGFWDENLGIFVIDSDLSFGTTAYAMELQAIRMALEYIHADSIIFTDCMQLIENVVMHNNRPKSHDELETKALFELKNKKYNIQIQWVKSHSDNVGNNTIDQKLELGIVKLIHELPNSERYTIVDIIKQRYDRKGCFESFSIEFFVGLLAD